MELDIGWSDGVTISTKECAIRFDPSKKGVKSFNFISHAHGDHTMGLSNGNEIFLTAETRDILDSGGRKNLNCNALKYDRPVEIDKLKITPFNAGHILGSAQFKIETPDLTIVYTGDINCRDMLTTSAAKAVSCDTLILETTYGNPSYIFPRQEEVYTEIIDWILSKIHEEKIPTFKVYSTGKAQEIMRLVNKFTTIPVVAHHTISKISEAYNKNGVALKYIDSNSEEGKKILREKQCVYITPSSEDALIDEDYSKAIATGWAMRYKSSVSYTAFPLSNHADFNQLLNYVEQAKPKRVYTVHGFRDDFGKYLKKNLGINAKPITHLSQVNLGRYI
ncbi:MAG: putative mRNA 3-end processing factor [Thermoproteota archaeon]|nr:putative mRNA 3-end processing factor [Thermoproteota archaeon]